MCVCVCVRKKAPGYRWSGRGLTAVLPWNFSVFFDFFAVVVVSVHLLRSASHAIDARR